MGILFDVRGMELSIMTQYDRHSSMSAINLTGCHYLRTIKNLLIEDGEGKLSNLNVSTHTS